MRDLKVAAVCMHSESGHIHKNLDRTESFVSEAAEKGTDIVCFPELSLTGYVLNNPGLIDEDFSSDRILKRVIGMAHTYDMIILAGIIEPSEKDNPHISHIIAAPDGLMGLYRKTHLSPQENARYQAGHDIGIFSREGSCFGVQLCYEAHFPEISTVMALKGADIIFFPHASPRGTPEEKRRSWLRHLSGRAFDNALFVVACNQVGMAREGFSFPGVIVVLNPLGHVMESYCGNQEKMLIVDLKQSELEAVRKHRMKYFLPHRRPELYRDICN